MFFETVMTPFDSLYVTLNMLDMTVKDCTERLLIFHHHAPDRKRALLFIWLLALRRTLPLYYEKETNPLQIFRDTIKELIDQDTPMLNRPVLRRVALSLRPLTDKDVKRPYIDFIQLLRPLIAIPDSACQLTALVTGFERNMFRKICDDNQYHMYWRQFCTLHKNIWEQSRAKSNWPSALLAPISISSVREYNTRLAQYEDVDDRDSSDIFRESSIFIWEYDVVKQPPKYEPIDWFDYSRPDRDYSLFSYVVALTLILLSLRIASKCLRHRSLKK